MIHSSFNFWWTTEEFFYPGVCLCFSSAAFVCLHLTKRPCPSCAFPMAAGQHSPTIFILNIYFLFAQQKSFYCAWPLSFHSRFVCLFVVLSVNHIWFYLKIWLRQVTCLWTFADDFRFSDSVFQDKQKISRTCELTNVKKFPNVKSVVDFLFVAPENKTSGIKSSFTCSFTVGQVHFSKIHKCRRVFLMLETW